MAKPRQMVRYSGAPEVPDRSYCSRMQRCQESRAPFPHTHTSPALLSSIPREVGTTPGAKVAGQAPPAPSGSACVSFRAPAPGPPTCHLEIGWQMAPGGPRWQDQGSVKQGVVCCEERVVGGRHHLVGRNPNLPEAAGSGMRWASSSASQAAVGTPCAPQGPSQPRLEANAHRERAGTSCVCSSDKTPRLQAELG